MKSIIISAFPGTGKSYLTNNAKEFSVPILGTERVTRFKLHDSDSSKYSWIYDAEGNKTDQRDPAFPDNYIEHIWAITKEDIEEDTNIIFVSSHESVREALVKAGFCFYIVRPDSDLIDQYCKNYRERGNDENFINLINKNWNQWLKDIDEFHKTYIEQVTLVELKRDAYMEQAVKALAETDFINSVDHIIVYADRKEIVCRRTETANK